MESQDTTASLILQNWKPNKDGSFPIVVRIYHQAKRRYYRTGVSVTTKDWDEETEEIKGRVRDNKTIHKALHKAEDTIKKIYTLHDKFDFELFAREYSDASPRIYSASKSKRKLWVRS